MAASLTTLPAAGLGTVPPTTADDIANLGDGGATGASMPAGLEIAALDKCPTGLAVRGTDMCTHGPDPIPDWIKERGGPRLIAANALGATAAVGCDGDGTSGKRVQALYLYVAGRTNRLSTFRDSMGAWAAYVDSMFDNSARETGGRARLRWVTSDCLLAITPVPLSESAEVDFGVMVAELTNLGYSRTDRKYLLWFDSDSRRSNMCGLGTIWGDDQPGPANANNNQTGYSRVDYRCWDFAESHELMHNLGGVQLSAPHSSGGWHCTDEHDQMCYADGAGVTLTYTCTDFEDPNIFDCGHDDYFHTSPATDSYLATHWNTARSDWIVGGEEAATELPPAVGSPVVSLLSDQTMTSTAQANVSWAPPSDASDVAGYQLQRKKGSGSWTNVILQEPLANQRTVFLTIGASHAFRVRAFDAVGNAGPWSTGGAATLRRLEETSSQLTYQSGFRRRFLTGASADHVRKANTTTRTATLTFNGTTVAFVSTLSPARGIVRISIDGGAWQDVDLYSPTIVKKRVVWAHGLDAGTHTLRVSVSGTRNAASTANRIDVDAFLIR